MTEPIMFVAMPVVLAIPFILYRLAVRMVFGQNPNGSGNILFGLLQCMNIVFGIMWGTLFAVSLYALTGLPHNPLDPSGPGFVNVFLILVPAIFLTLREDGHVGAKGFRILALVTLIVIDIGLPAALYFKNANEQPSIGLHVSAAVEGSKILAEMVNSCDKETPQEECTERMQKIANRSTQPKG